MWKVDGIGPTIVRTTQELGPPKLFKQVLLAAQS
jgi:hypothetical protein